MHHAMLCSFLCYSFLTVRHARYAVRDVTYLDGVITAVDLVKYLQNLSCMNTNIVAVCELEACLGQHMCIKHTDICGLRFHVDRMSRNSTAVDLSCWHKRYCFWLLLRSIRFVLRSKRLLRWLRCFQAYSCPCVKFQDIASTCSFHHASYNSLFTKHAMQYAMLTSL